MSPSSFCSKATYLVYAADRSVVRYYDTIKEAKPVAIAHGGTVERNFCTSPSRRLVHDFRAANIREWHVANGYC